MCYLLFTRRIFSEKGPEIDTQAHYTYTQIKHLQSAHRLKRTMAQIDND